MPFSFTPLGIVFIGLGRICVPAFYSMKDTKTPVKAAAVALVVNVLALPFVARTDAATGNRPGQYAFGTGSGYRVAVLVQPPPRTVEKRTLDRLAVEDILATALMTLAGWGVSTLLFPDPVDGRLEAALRLSVLIPFCVAIFGGVLLALKARKPAKFCWC